MLAGTHNKFGNGTEEASNTGIEEGGPSVENKGHCSIGAVSVGVECVGAARVEVLETGEAASGELVTDRGTLSTR